MKKLLFLVLISAIMVWGCSALVYVSDTGQLMKAREDAPLLPSNLFTTNNSGKMPDVSNDNKWVAFTRSPDDKVVYRKMDGSLEKVLTQKGSWPRWSPNGDRILFYDQDQNKRYIYKIMGETLTEYNLPDNYGHDWWNSETVVYGRKTGSNVPGYDVGLYLFEISTTNDIGPFLPCRYPVVSRDGKLMACELPLSLAAVTYHIIKIYNVPSLSLKSTITFARIPNVPSIWNVGGFSFSGDNQRLLFSATPPNETQREIYSVNVDGTDIERLSTITGNDIQPSGYYKRCPW
jgi:hypothetical protein